MGVQKARDAVGLQIGSAEDVAGCKEAAVLGHDEVAVGFSTVQ